MTKKGLKEIGRELVRRADIDQVMRKEWADSGFKPARYDKAVDVRNTKYLKDVVSKYGWPYAKDFGRGAPKSAWLIAQHASSDRKFQWAVLRMLRKVPDSGVSLKLMATMEDKLRVSEGRKQKYGTQFHIDLKTQVLIVPPIVNKKALEKLRAQMHLRPFDVQLKRVQRSVSKMRTK